MKTKKSIKIVISVVSLVMVMLISGCSNESANTNNQQPTASNSITANQTEGKADLSGWVAKIDGSKITIAKTTQKGSNDGVSPKRGIPLPAEKTASFEISNDTKVTVRTMEHAFSNTASKYTDAEGSIKDIKEGSSVNVWGKKEGDTFKATKVLVYIFNR